MKIPKFKSESEEADWWYQHRHDKSLWGKPLRNPDGKTMTAEQVVENRKELDARAAQKIRSGKAKPLTQETLEDRLKPSQPITIRLSVADIERAKMQAAQKGLAYQTYLKSLIHQALAAQ